METAGGPEPRGIDPLLPRDTTELRAALKRPPRKLSEELNAVLREFKEEHVTLREIIAVLHGRGYVLLLLLLALPFATPIPLPGLSTPFGLMIALIAARLALGQKPWLPARLLDRNLSSKLFARVLSAACKILKFFELFLRPRIAWLTGSPAWLQVHSVPILFGALLLLLPIPVPFSNTLPAFTILLVAAGLLERDGLFILGGYAAFACALAFFWLIGFAGFESLDFIKDWFANRGGGG